jgi:hypothetical protein
LPDPPQVSIDTARTRDLIRTLHGWVTELLAQE